MRVARVDCALGIGVMLVAGVYLSLAAQIPTSLLSDEVGAGGLPTAVGWALVLIGALLVVRSVAWKTAPVVKVVPAAAADAAAAASAESAEGDEDAPPGGMRPHWLALGLVAMMFVFVNIAPLLGYVASTTLLLAGVALFAGAPRQPKLFVTAFLGAAALWFLFDYTLSIPLPVGALFTRG